MEGPSSLSSDEYEIEDAADVHEVIEWANGESERRETERPEVAHTHTLHVVSQRLDPRRRTRTHPHSGDRSERGSLADLVLACASVLSLEPVGDKDNSVVEERTLASAIVRGPERGRPTLFVFSSPFAGCER
jgi:hypothetical protein